MATTAAPTTTVSFPYSPPHAGPRLPGLILPAIGVFLAHGLLIKTFIRDPRRRKQLLIENVSSYSRWALRRLGIDVSLRLPENLNDNYLVVSNHLSYLDMMVIASVLPAAFVTSVDMGEMFFLGTMAEIGGSLFIERRHRERIDHDRNQIAQHLREGFHVVLFPEGTSSDGSAVLPFKKALLTSAIEAGKQILPLTLTYTHIDGEPFSHSNCDRVCWYGKMRFLPHLIGLMSLRSVSARLHFHLPIEPREGDTRETLAKWTYRIVSGSYHQIREAE